MLHPPDVPDAEYASRARKACDELNHRLYVLNVERNWEARDHVAYIPAVLESWLRLRDVMEEWALRREAADGAEPEIPDSVCNYP